MRLTLQNRVTTLMIISSVIFISAFAVIQVNNRVEALNQRNVYQARLSSIIVKNNLEATIRQASAEEMSKYLDSGLKELSETDIVKEAFIFSPDGKIVAGTEGHSVTDVASYKDMARLVELEKISKEGRWFVFDIDKAEQSIIIYLALKLKPDGPINYIVKLTYALGDIKDALFDVYKPIAITILIVILANILLGYLLSKSVIGPIKVLNDVTKIIAGGDLSIRTRIRTNDELEELGSTFNHMTEELVKMKEKAENANPLTKLPGNIVIREEVENRIKEDKKFTVIYTDLDNFKAFNDKYGISKGDEAIKLCSDVFKEAIKSKGNADDFIGHEGGDDFILLTTPDKAKDVADFITTAFDKGVRGLYNKEDLAEGYIVAHARDNTIKKFAIMTISMAGVTNEQRKITSYPEVMDIAAGIKKKAKALEKSVFVIDKRSS
ncbi:MAG: diguanylate cyclase [Candidatus Omnitrophica bacterium]|nr:diguanylate cyclase [Candidatus Omnitrophota bacterium]